MMSMLARGGARALQPLAGGVRASLGSASVRAAWPCPAVRAAGVRAPATASTVRTATTKTAARSKRGRRARSGGYVLLGRAQAAKLLRLQEKMAGHAAKNVKKTAEAKEAAAAAAAAAEATSRLRSSLSLRFGNENSFLNWARNGVLSSGVGVAMYAQEHHRGAQLSGAGLLLLGFGYIGVGTAKYMWYILRYRHVMELSWGSVVGTISHAMWGLGMWLTAVASFLESVPLELDAMLLTEPLASYLPFRIRQGLIETYSLHLDDLEHHNDEQERVLRAIRGGKDSELVGMLEDDDLSPELEAKLLEHASTGASAAPGPQA